MEHTKSNLAASRYLGCSYQHYKKWAKLYKSDKEGYDTLFDEHKNQSGKGIPKHFGGLTPSKTVPLEEILDGSMDPSSFKPRILKDRIITDGYLKEECSACGFTERRVIDYKMPLIMHFKDKNKYNYKLENLELLCYNCYFLRIGDVFDNKQIKGLESHKSVNLSEIDWEIDEYQLERLEELGLVDKEDEFDIVAYRK